jgi:hypothetical protein
VYRGGLESPRLAPLLQHTVALEITLEQARGVTMRQMFRARLDGKTA